ncbi:CCA tRNA nucleotidyltransferase [Brevibacillus sp. SYP-B805]|uniref:CCA tRNA nucleotidyltransferase n=1 Tax=Brevibacillus sp. SYP-B805 TaxID=1578199 RepID=UPI0013EBD8CF|nr:CCA tRNA nucleotidyltransferase [Brevibacillus sp. SYP-B805]NGQ94538.1 CCA tRNA nucleotidyltransferase [Brevibacillus sp. SYP-B805]
MLKEYGRLVLQQLEENGYEAYFVGGCVRDWLLKRTVQDIDICTNAHPGDVMRLFPEHVPTGLKHGTVSVKAGPYRFEVTTYRTEGQYADFRRPSEVTFVTDLQVDLARRDFTINAMAMDRRDKLVDPFGGQADAAQRLIRAVGVPDTRFREDALRLLRAARFAAQLGFAVEEKTLAAMADTADLLIHIAVERIREELAKLLDSPHPEAGIDLINRVALLRALPLLSPLFQIEASMAARLTLLDSLPQKWAWLLYARGANPEQAHDLCLFLRMAKRETEAIVRSLAILHDLAPAWDEPRDVPWEKLLLLHGLHVCREVERLLTACWWDRRSAMPANALAEAYERLPVKSGRELAISGRDLQEALGKQPGEWIRHTLSYLLEQTALHGLPNTPERLLDAARKEVARYEKHQA